MTKFMMSHVTQINSLPSVQIDGIPHHVKDLHSSRNDNDLEVSERLVNLGSIALGKPDESPDDGLFEDRMTSQDDSLNTGGQNA